MALKKVVTGLLYFLAIVSGCGVLASLTVHFLTFFAISFPEGCVVLFYVGIVMIIPAGVFCAIESNSERLSALLKKALPGEQHRTLSLQKSLQSFLEKVHNSCPAWLTFLVIAISLYFTVNAIPARSLYGLSLTVSEMTPACVRKEAALMSLLYMIPFTLYYCILRMLKGSGESHASSSIYQDDSDDEEANLDRVESDK